MLEITEENIGKLKSANLAILDVWAPWCGPCRMFLPVYEAMAQSGKFEKVLFAKMNADESGSLSQEFGVRSIPTIIFLKNGEVVDTHIGGMNDDQLEQFIEKNI